MTTTQEDYTEQKARMKIKIREIKRVKIRQ